jgi:hypothetical protein
MIEPGLEMYTVYDHPRDYPEHFVVRKWILDKATDDVRLFTDLDTLRNEMKTRGLYRLNRWPDDDVKILETWI